jgi:single-strand DNA-binding protein
MSSENFASVTGNATRDPELRYTQSGAAVVNFGLAHNHRRFNKSTNEWDEETSFFDVTAWYDLAENIAETVSKGMRLVVTGRLNQDTWETQDGDKRSKVEIVADSVAPDLRWATAEVSKVDRREGAGTGGNAGGRSSGGASRSTGRSGGGRPSFGDEEPFRIDAGEWWPEVGIGPKWPTRLLP